VYRDRIRTIYEHLSPGYRRIADFILTRYQDAAFMTAAEVARSATVDTALVVRFAQRLGYVGYPELIGDIQEDVKRDLRSVYDVPAGDNSPGQVLRRSLMQDRNTLEYMYLHLDLDAVEVVVETMLGASRLFVIGEGNASHLAEGFVMQLLILGLSAHALSAELAGCAAQMASIHPGDVFLGLGLTAMTPGVTAVLQSARNVGAKTIGITGSPALPLAAVAEHVLVAPVQATEDKPSWTATAAMLNGLSHVLAARKGEPDANRMLDADHYLSTYVAMLRKHHSGARTTGKPHSAKK
jgi:DNA-binding MurR/RpiR family transcriptional regulator